MDISEFYKNNPLLKFHFYIHSNAVRVIKLGEYICNILDNSISHDGKIDAQFLSAYDGYWFWVLGAYEVLRTLSDPRYVDTFTARKLAEIKQEKQLIAKVRMPFAKLEFKGKREVIHGENSIYGFDSETKDFCLKIGRDLIYARKTILRFKTLIESIKSEHVMKTIEKQKANKIV